MLATMHDSGSLRCHFSYQLTLSCFKLQAASSVLVCLLAWQQYQMRAAHTRAHVDLGGGPVRLAELADVIEAKMHYMCMHS